MSSQLITTAILGIISIYRYYKEVHEEKYVEENRSFLDSIAKTDERQADQVDMKECHC